MAPTPFEGKLVRLRAREPEDEPWFYRWINDHDVREHLEARYAFSHAQEREFLSTPAEVGYEKAGFGIETLAGGQLIGSCALRDTSPENRSAELGIMIGEKSYWDGGYGTDAMRVLCRFGFEMMNLHRIELEVFAENARARHVYEKIGFRTEASLRDSRYRNGRYIDVVVMGLLEGELKWE